MRELSFGSRSLISRRHETIFQPKSRFNVIELRFDYRDLFSNRKKNIDLVTQTVGISSYNPLRPVCALGCRPAESDFVYPYGVMQSLRG